MTNKAINIENERLNSLLLKITCTYWLLVKVIGWRMFTTNRIFPAAPVFEWMDQVPVMLHMVIFVLSLLLIGLIFFLPKNKLALAALLITETCSCMLDQNRWQPWEYQCIFTVFIFLVNRNRQASIIPVLTFILASIYFYSGCNKLNEGFLQNIWVQLVMRSFFKVAVARQSWLYYCGYLLALFELACGAALLFAKTKKTAAWLLILMHLFILAWLGPSGLNYNPIIWPWNMAMMIYLYLVILKGKGNVFALKDILPGLNKLVLICWGVLPALGVMGYWDAYLSSGIYSGKAPYMIICVGNVEKAKDLKPFISESNSKICESGTTIRLSDWAAKETMVLPNPEPRVYKLIQKKLEKKYAGVGLRCTILITGNNYSLK